MQTNAESQPEQSATADFYETLQVSPKAEQEVIEAAYKRLALKYHPDLNQTPEATRRMQELNVAYGILSDPAKRAEYDQEREGARPAHSSRHPRHANYVRRQRRSKSQAEPKPQTEQETPPAANPEAHAADSSYDYAEPDSEETEDDEERPEREWSYVSSGPRWGWIVSGLGLVVAVILAAFLLFGPFDYSHAFGNSPAVANPAVTANLPPNVLFEDDFDTVAGANWLLDAPWHLTTRSAASGTHSLWIGEEGKDSYRAKLNVSATLVRPVDLSGTQNPLMRFRLSGQFDTEINPTGHDRLLVEVAESGHDFETAFNVSGTYPTWQDMLVDLSKWKGKTVVIRFRFNSGPTATTVFSGPFIDDVRIER